MKGSSAPGIDGFTVNWLRKFWSSLKGQNAIEMDL